MFWNQYPYINLNDLNLDFLLKAIGEMRNEVTNFVSINAIKYADPIQWDITRQYEKNTIVIDPVTGTAYISVAPVPSGVALTRPEYWTVVFDLGSFVTRAAQNFTSRWENDTTTTATFATPAGAWLVWGDVLYKALVNITAGDTYVVGSNIEHFTIEDLIASITQAIADEVQARQDADIALSDRIDDEVQARQDADNLIDLKKANKSDVVVVINALENGCVADGTTDNVAAINAIIADAPAGSTIYFPCGKYYISNAIDVNKRLQIIGDGGNGYDAPTVFKVDNGGFNLNASGCVLKGMKVVALAHCSVGVGIYQSMCEVIDVDVDDDYSNLANYFDVSFQCGNIANGFWFDHIANCSINSRHDDGLNMQSKMLGTGFSFIGAVNSLVTDCFITKKNKAINLEDIATAGGYYNDGVTFDNINVTWCYYGLYCEHATSIYFSNSIIDQSNIAMYLDKCVNAEFTNLHVGQNNGGVGTDLIQTTDNAQYVAIVNADIFGQSATTGILAGNAKNCTYQNIFLHNFKYGINVSATGKNITGSDIFCDNVDYGVIAFTPSFFKNVKGSTVADYNSLAFADAHIETITGEITDLGTANYYGLSINQQYGKKPSNVIFTPVEGGTLGGTHAISYNYREASSTTNSTAILIYSSDNSQFNNESLKYAVTLIYDK